MTLQPGQYLVNFVSDGGVTASGTLGAALALDGTPLPYAEMSLAQTPSDTERVAITAILNIDTPQTLTVRNNAANTNTYNDSTLTVVKLA